MYSYFKLTLWAILWFFLWIMMAPFRNGRENCLTYAVKRWDTEGGYLAIRWCRSNKSKWIIWPHFAWLPEKYQRFLEHAVPENKEHDSQLIPDPWFKPKIKKGDRKEEIAAEN